MERSLNCSVLLLLLAHELQVTVLTISPPNTGSNKGHLNRSFKLPSSLPRSPPPPPLLPPSAFDWLPRRKRRLSSWRTISMSAWKSS